MLRKHPPATSHGKTLLEWSRAAASEWGLGLDVELEPSLVEGPQNAARCALCSKLNPVMQTC